MKTLGFARMFFGIIEGGGGGDGMPCDECFCGVLYRDDVRRKKHQDAQWKRARGYCHTAPEQMILLVQPCATSLLKAESKCGLNGGGGYTAVSHHPKPGR